MFIFITQTCFALLSFGRSLACIDKVSDCTKCVSLSNELVLAGPILNGLNPNELPVDLCNTFDDLSGRNKIKRKM